MEGFASLPLTQSTRRAIKKRTILLYQGEVPRQAYIVQKGTVKLYRLGRNGDEQIVGFRLPGDMFPEGWMFNKTSSALYYYEAIEDCEITTVERSVFHEHIQNHPKLKEDLMNYFVDSTISLNLQITALEQPRAADKLLLTLYFLLFRYSKRIAPDEYELRFHMTHTTLGNLTGLTRETTSVELGRLRRKGVVDYNGAHFVIHKKQLEQHLAKESFSDIQVD